MPILTAMTAGALFAAGLVLSGMTDTRAVLGFLDLFGEWNPALAFVMAGAILPMALAWRVAARRDRSLSGRCFPAPAAAGLSRPLIAGSVLFGVGWGLVGLCPGPAMATATTGGLQGAVFLLAMVAGMIGAIPARRRSSLART